MLAVSLTTTDPDEALEHCAGAYFPHRMELFHDVGKFEMCLNGVSVDSVFAGILRYSGEVELTTRELEDGYQVNVPLQGSLLTSVGEDRVAAGPTVAAVYRPDSPSTLRGWSGGGALYGMKIPRVLLESALSDATGTPVTGPLRLSSTLDLGHGAGRQWWSLVRSLLDIAVQPSGPMTSPAVLRPLVRGIVVGLLHAVDHPQRDLLTAGGQPARPAVIERAVALVDEGPAAAWTASELAARSGVSLRALQEGFARHVGMPPMSYVRQVRLERAHHDLTAADPSRVTVADIATRWGFAHLGRFAHRYRSRYGSSPSATLRAG